MVRRSDPPEQPLVHPARTRHAGVLQVFLDKDLYTARVEFEHSSRFSLRPGSDIDKTLPLGLATYQTRAYWRNFTLCPITALEAGDKPLGE